MTKDEAQALLPEREAQLKQAWQAYVEARRNLVKARDDLSVTQLIARGEFSDDESFDQFEVSYYGLVRKVEPTPQRCHAVGSRGPWGWVS